MVQHDLVAALAWLGDEARSRILDDQGKLRCDIEDWRVRSVFSEAIRRYHDATIDTFVAFGYIDASLRQLWFFQAASHGRDDYVKLLLESGDVDPDSNNPGGKTPLCRAAENGHLAVVQLLLQSGRVSHEVRGHYYHQDPISCAAGAGHNAIVKVLLDHGAAPDVIDRDGRTPLSRAAAAGHKEVVKTLIDAPVNPDLADEKRRTPFWYAAAGGHTEVCEQLTATEQVNMSSKDYVGETPFIAAVRHGRINVVKIFLDPSSVGESIMDQNGGPALREAVGRNNEEMVHLLLSSDKIPVDSRAGPNDEASTPFHTALVHRYNGIARILAATGKVDMLPTYRENLPFLDLVIEQRNVEMVRLLLESGQAQPNKHSSLYGTPLIHAAGKGNAEIVRLLLSTKRVGPNCKDASHRRTALMWASFYGHTSVVEMLLRIRGLEVEAKDKMGRTALVCAAERGHDECIRLLLRKGRAEVDTREKMGRTPLSFAAEWGHLSTVRILLEQGGADASLRDAEGATAYDYASRRRHGEVAALLLPSTKGEYGGNTP